MHLQKVAFGSGFRTSIKIAALDPRVERSVLGDSACTSSGIVGVDGAGIYEPLHASSQCRFGDFPCDAYLVALVIGPALRIGSGQVVHAVDSAIALRKATASFKSPRCN